MVYICIPAYNEERTIGVVLWKVREVMAEFGRDYQVLVVDDASTDGTADVIEPYIRIMPIHMRRNERRAGYATTLEALVKEAVRRAPYPKRDCVVTLQADFTDEPSDVETLVKRIEGGADVVTGRVRLEGEGMPAMLRWSRRAWQYVLQRGNGEEQGDPLSGFRAYRVLSLQKAIDERGDRPLLTADGWAANAQLLDRVALHARRVEAVDVSVRYGRRERATRFRPFRSSLELARLLLPARLQRSGPPVPAEAATGTSTESSTWPVSGAASVDVAGGSRGGAAPGGQSASARAGSGGRSEGRRGGGRGGRGSRGGRGGGSRGGRGGGRPRRGNGGGGGGSQTGTG